jgi:hypothetical protein
MAEVKRKKIKKVSAKGVAHIKSTFNNTRILFHGHRPGRRALRVLRKALPLPRSLPQKWRLPGQ